MTTTIELPVGSLPTRSRRILQGTFKHGGTTELPKKYSITDIEYVYNPVLERRFQDCVKTEGGATNCYSVIGWHGTSNDAIESIIKAGFLTKFFGQQGLLQGRGIYLSEYSRESFAFTKMKQGSKMLVCKGLMRNSNKNPGGHPMAQDLGKRNQWAIVFQDTHPTVIRTVVPVYIVTFKALGAQA